MEDLTKQQIVLVTLLVSFVTSIATGIVTVSLMDQAPPGMTQTINRVVERTIERVVQAPSQAAVITKETVVVKEDELVVSSIEKNMENVVRISYVSPEEGSVIGLGLVVSKDGIVVIDSYSVRESDTYVARFSNGRKYSLKRVFDAKDSEFSLFKIVVPESESVNFSYALLADSDKIKLGQALVFIGGREENVIETGVVSSFEYEKSAVSQEGTSTTTSILEIARKISGVSLTVQPKSSVGGILTNLSSDIVAMGVIRESLRFVPSNSISTLLSTYASVSSSGTTTPPVKNSP